MKNDDDALSARLDKLEELVAHQVLTLEEVSSELLRLNKAHEDLMRRHKALIARLEDVEDTHGEAAPTQQKPPHY